ncbi:MAG: M48 family metallopeptidase [Akkermansiaceae bacterium]
MNFFTAQDKARSRTRWLVLWFALATLATVASLYAITGLLMQWRALALGAEVSWIGHPLSFWTAAISAIVIPSGSVYKLRQLSQGGAVVARDLGARRIHPMTNDFSERQLLNVVEEMAIASAIPVPEVWVMDEEYSINAFAAGTEPSNAVLGVSRGCLKKLSRSELQGVVAHEFSHILNGDMRLNMRLIGWVFGLLMIAMTGRALLSSLRNVRLRGSGDGKGDSGNLFMIVAGLILWLVGSLGVLFARIVQAAVSRQREYLADASAVLFTRDPSGMIGALKKIARLPQQRVFSSRAAEAAHLFFHGPVGYFMPGLLATHPPLIQRIHAIDPMWDGDLRRSESEESHAANVPAHDSFPDVASFAASNRTEPTQAWREMNLQGNIRTVAEARALMFSLVAGKGRSFLTVPATDLSEAERAAFDHWLGVTRGMKSAKKIAWMDQALLVLRQMTPDEFHQFSQDIQTWMNQDGEISGFEWMLSHAIHRHLRSNFEQIDAVPVRWHHISQVEESLAQLLACLCDQSMQPQSFSLCQDEYLYRFGRALPRVKADFQNLQSALSNMEAASDEVKEQILDLCHWTSRRDGMQCNGEVEMLRAAADAIGVSIPK